MKYTIIVSKKDIAGMNIKAKLLELFPFKERGLFGKNHYYQTENVYLYTTENDTINCESIDKEVEGDVIIFATRHKSEKKDKVLCVHTPGNWSKAELGGKDNRVCCAPASLMKEAIKNLNMQAKGSEYKVSQECTHHGPYVNMKPCMFIEIGSTEKEWNDKNAARILAQALMHTIKHPMEFKKIALGIGGLHYAQNFMKITYDTEIAIGHICPKYMLEHLDYDKLKHALERTWEEVNLIIVDWKGLGKHKEEVKKIVELTGIEWKKTKDF